MIIDLFKALSSADVWQVALNTLRITGLATLLALVIGIPIAFFLALVDFPFKKFIMSFVNTGMGLPPVIAGLLVSFLFWRSGILGFLGLMYTREAMIIAEFIIATPIVIALSVAALQTIDKDLILQIKALGANKFQTALTIMKESRLSTSAAIIAGYGAIVSEVGAAAMVGGDIKGQTRVLTTAILLETRRGNFEMAMALGFILLAVALTINIYMTRIQQREELWMKKR